MQESQKPRKDTHKGKYLQTKPSVLETLPILSCWQTSVEQQWRPEHWDSIVKGLRENLSTKVIAANYQV